jgi:hypothetical protein
MLRVIGIAPTSSAELTVDPYIAFKFRAYETGLPLPGPYLWYTGNLQTSLFELTIERSTGMVRGATLVLPGSDAVVQLQSGYEALPRKTGLPIIDRSALTTDIWDEPCNFTLLQKKNDVYIAFGSSWKPSSCLGVDRIAFFEAEGFLCGVGFFQLTQEEMTLVKGTIPSIV